MQYYYRDTFERENCEQFEMLTDCYPDIHFFQPSPIKAPWHIQAFLDDGSDEPIELNFWPHKAKGQRRPEKAVEGWASIHAVIASALRDAGSAENADCDLIE